MSMAESLGFSDEEGGLASFVTLVKLLQGFDETEPGFNWANYLCCVSVMPGKAGKPSHPLHLPLSFRAEGPPELLPQPIAESMERRFALLRSLRKQLADSMSPDGGSSAAEVAEVGPQAMAAIRGLGDDLEVERFASGETYALALKLRRAIAANQVGKATLIHIVHEHKEVWESDLPRASKIPVFVFALIYRLPSDWVSPPSTPTRMRELEGIAARIEATFVKLFPEAHALAELRDADAATVWPGRMVGPSYAAVKQKIEATRAKAREEGLT